MNVVHWAATMAGKLVAAPGGLGGQCVDLANLYMLARGFKEVHANAIDWAKAGTLPPPWHWVANAPLNHPHLGDLAVWGEESAVGTGQYGHIAVVLAGDALELLSLDQDWPIGSPASLVLHDYRGVRGWWAHDA